MASGSRRADGIVGQMQPEYGGSIFQLGPTPGKYGTRSSFTTAVKPSPTPAPSPSPINTGNAQQRRWGLFVKKSGGGWTQTAVIDVTTQPGAVSSPKAYALSIARAVGGGIGPVGGRFPSDT